MIKEHTFDMLLEEWEPRFKHFRPPMWKIFRWAYKFNRTLLKDCYPASISISNDENITNEFMIDFSVNKFESDNVTSAYNQLIGRRGTSITHKDDMSEEEVSDVFKAWENWLSGVNAYDGK